MVYKGAKKTYDFRNFKTIRTFGNEIRNNVITFDTANIERVNLNKKQDKKKTKQEKNKTTESCTETIEG